MKNLLLLLSLCACPIAAFSAQFATTTRTSNSHILTPTRSVDKSSLHTSKLHLRIPRGGQQHVDDGEETDVIDLDIVPEMKKSSAWIAPLVSMAQNLGSSYSTSLTTRPIITKSGTAGLTFLLSDVCAQNIENKNKKDAKYDWTRTLVSTAVGLFYFGPAAHLWYDWVFSILPSTSLVSTLQKAALGQLIFGPVFTCVFFATSLMQSGTFSVNTWTKKIKTDLPAAWLSGTGFWPLVDLISFSIVPVKFIPLFVNFCSFVWTIYLSMVANRSVQK
jgi:hypothetical protein